MTNLDTRGNIGAMSEIVMNFDGSCWPNPGGKAGAGVVLTCDGKPLETIAEVIGTGPEYSNNYAELYAAMLGFENIYCILLENPNIQYNIFVRGDSQLAINLLIGRFKARKDKLYYPAYIKAADRLKEIKKLAKSVTFLWVPRELNTEADALSTSN